MMNLAPQKNRLRIALGVCILIIFSSCSQGSSYELAFANNYKSQFSSDIAITEDSSICFAKKYLENADRTKIEEAGITEKLLSDGEVDLSSFANPEFFADIETYNDVQRKSLDCLSKGEIKRLLVSRASLDDESLNEQADCIIEDLGKANLVNLMVGADENGPNSEDAVTLQASFEECNLG